MILRALGRAPRERDPRTLRLADYSLPALPTADDWGLLRQFRPTLQSVVDPELALKFGRVAGRLGFDLFDNDTRPNCTCAEFGHLDQVVAEHTASPTDVTTEMVNKAHTAIAPSPTSGASMLRAARWFRNAGVLAAFVELDVDNPVRFVEHIKLAIHLYGGAPLGFNLPLAWEGKTYWDHAPDERGDAWKPGSWGGHALLGTAYDETGIRAVMWGKQGFITWRALVRYCDEGYVAIHRRWANGVRTPGGELASAIVNDLMKLGHVR